MRTPRRTAWWRPPWSKVSGQPRKQSGKTWPLGRWRLARSSAPGSAAVAEPHASAGGGQTRLMPGGRKLGEVAEGERRAAQQDPVSRIKMRPVRADGLGPIQALQRGKDGDITFPNPFILYNTSGNSGLESIGDLPKVPQLKSNGTASHFLLGYYIQYNLGSLNGSSGSFLKSWLTLCDPMDCSPPGYSVHGIFQARVLEWVPVSFSRGSSRQGSNLCLLYLLYW